MPYYYFEAATADGRIRKKILRARDKKDADSRIRSSGLRPMLIESTHAIKKKKQEKALHTRHIVQNTLLTVAGISLVGGIAGYLIMLDFSSAERFDVETLSRSGIVSHASSIINAESQEERDFARDVFGIWDMSYPDSISGIEIKHKGLMLIYVKGGRKKFGDDSLRLLASTVARAFQRRFGTNNCMVLVVHGNDTLAESRYRKGEVKTLVY